MGGREAAAELDGDRLLLRENGSSNSPTGFKFCDFMQSWHILGEKI